MRLKKSLSSLSFWIFFALFAGVVTGMFMGESASLFKPLGDLFIRLVKMLVVPLVLISILTGAAALGASKNAGKMGLATLSYIFITTFIAVGLALLGGIWFQPGGGIAPELVQKFIGTSPESTLETAGFWEVLLSIIPDNPIAALAEGNILQIILFGLFLGFGISSLAESRKAPLLNGLNILLEGLIWCITKVMYIAPLGVFGLMAEATGTFGFDLLLKVGNLLWLNIALVLLVGLGLYPLSLRLFSRQKVAPFMKSMIKPQLFAFSTASSLATLPLNMSTCENELGLHKSTVSFVLPLGATINMTGNAIYYTLVALFFAQFYGIDLSLSQYIAIALTASLGSIGQAGVPGPTLLVVAVLASAGIPLEGLPLLYALDRIFDMIRTTLNITGDAVCAAVIDPLNRP